MSSVIDAKGSCLCGSVNVHVNSMTPDIGACHCSMCRRWGGGPLLAIDCKSDVVFSGEEYITKFDSSEWAERGFCSECGTHLFYRVKQNNQYIVSAGLFNEATAMNFDHQVFIDEKPDYYSFANETRNMTGEEVFAYFANESST